MQIEKLPHGGIERIMSSDEKKQVKDIDTMKKKAIKKPEDIKDTDIKTFIFLIAKKLDII